MGESRKEQTETTTSKTVEEPANADQGAMQDAGEKAQRSADDGGDKDASGQAGNSGDQK